VNHAVKWMAAALVVSVALNVFVLGFFAGRGLDRDTAGGRDHVAAGPEPDFVLRTLARQLPEETRADLRASFRERREQLRPTFRELRAVRGRLAELLTAEDYDEAAVRETMAEMRRVEARLKQPVHETIADALAGLSAEQRRAFVATIADHRRAGHPIGGGESR